MATPRLNVRSAVVCDLARELSRREGRTIRAIVEDALEEYAKRDANMPAENQHVADSR